MVKSWASVDCMVMIDLDEWADTHGEIRMTRSQFEREESVAYCDYCGEFFHPDELDEAGLCEYCREDEDEEI